MTVFTAPERVDPSYVEAERPGLEAWLDWHRATLLSKCDGLDADQLARRSVPPSTLSLLGLVRHMAEVEQWWFRQVLPGGAATVSGSIYCTDASPDEDFDGARAETAEADRDTYLAEVSAAREVAARYDLDDVGQRRGKDVSLRWIYVHMIEEYARHNGHADLLREAIDGVTGD
jgi:uncharacterized damage-inducible protein DinB